MKNPVDRLYNLALSLALFKRGTEDEKAAAALELAEREAWELAQEFDQNEQDGSMAAAGNDNEREGLCGEEGRA